MKLPRLLILPAWTTLLALVSCDWLFAQAEPVPVARLIYKTVVPTAQKEASIWRHTFAQPAANWFKPGFDDASWKQGQAGFGTEGTPGAIVRTVWNTADIWLRRTIELPQEKFDDLAFLMHHDEDAEVYLNGVLAAKVRRYLTDYQVVPISAEAKAALKPGKNLLAVHCHQTTGGQYIDVGIVAATPSKSVGYFPPAVPLVAHDPYFSIWSEADHLTDDWPRHWTGKPNSLTSMIRIDDTTYRLMGMPDSQVPVLPQTALQVLPTRTIYRFAGAGVAVTLTFLTPALPDDLDVLARPVTYLTWDVMATDGKQHAVSLYYDNSAELCVHDPGQNVLWVDDWGAGTKLVILRVGKAKQVVLDRAGDQVRIDWGQLYAAAVREQVERFEYTRPDAARNAYALDGGLIRRRDPLPTHASQLVLAFTFNLGKVSWQSQSRTLMLAYDEIFAIELMGKKLRPYWQHNSKDMADLLQKAAKEFPALRERCEKFDRELIEDLAKAGGKNYERIGALAYRQALAGCGLAVDEGKPLMFAKENTSNGCIATVDVQYPACPLFLLFNPKLLQAHLDPVFDYAESPRWKFPFAPHDLGTYPKANGQVYGGGEKTERDQMPVEESGNMLLMVAGLCKIQGNADYALLHWKALTRWTEYLRDKGFDPENQLCTDDFAGHLAHNVNLSAKAIVALGGYAMMAEMLGKKATAGEYRKLAEEFARRWVKEADDGDHYRLAFDKAGTWSQKYNLVWDQLLGLKLFPPDVIQKEMAFYRKAQHRFGLPLDNRADYTKTDWLLWTATLGSRDDFDALVAPLADFLAFTPTRVPFADFYETSSGKGLSMYARPVIGGVFIKLLAEEATWKKWAGRAK